MSRSNRLRIQRQTYWTDCDHPEPRRCHPIDGQHSYSMWHLVDPDGTPTDDGPWYSAAEARRHLPEDTPS